MTDREIIADLVKALEEVRREVEDMSDLTPIMPLLDTIDAALALTKDSGDGWQPIETAPKDGDFLAYLSHGYITRGRFLNRKVFACDSTGPRVRHDDPSPTHWMPIPEPPQ